MPYGTAAPGYIAWGIALLTCISNLFLLLNLRHTATASNTGAGCVVTQRKEAEQGEAEGGSPERLIFCAFNVANDRGEGVQSSPGADDLRKQG